MIRALAYLVCVSARNTLLARVRQVRSPRYAIALALGIGYFWLVFFNRAAREGRQPGPLLSETFGALLPIGLLAFVAFLWIFGADRAALAFTPAEVSMLFAAPVSRRALVVYKLVRAQAAVLTTSVFWLVLFHGDGPSVPRVFASWVFLTTLSLHRLGVAVARASQSEHGFTAVRKRWLPITAFGLAASVVACGLFAGRARFRAVSEPGEIGRVLISEFARAPLSWVLYPFRVAVAPMFVQSADAWVSATGAALVLLAAHVVWVLRGDTAFEEAAVEASAAQARRLQARRARGATGGLVDPKRARRSIALAPTGPPGIALIWKNYLWLMRTGQMRGLFGLPAIALIGCLAFAGRSATAEVFVAIICLVMTTTILMFGPMVMRNDLRGELRRLPVLKTMPLRGREIVLAEVASSASPTALMQFLLAAVALLALSFIPQETLPVAARVGMLIAAPVLLLGLNIANFTIHNGMALLFPAWVRLGDGGGAGVEAMGQMVLTSVVTLLLLAVLLVLPAAGGIGVFVAMGPHPLVAVVGAGVTAGVVCGLEAYLLIGALGGVLDRLEPTHLA